jgi:hypothetical protein
MAAPEGAIDRLLATLHFERRNLETFDHMLKGKR